MQESQQQHICSHIKRLTKKVLQQTTSLATFNHRCASCNIYLFPNHCGNSINICLYCGVLICANNNKSQQMCTYRHFASTNNLHIFTVSLVQQQETILSNQAIKQVNNKKNQINCHECGNLQLIPFLIQQQSQKQQECLNQQQKTPQQLAKIQSCKNKLQINRFIDFLQTNVLGRIQKAVESYARQQMAIHHDSSSQQQKQTLHQPYGLVNLGNTCYINVVIQVLNHMKPLNQYYLNQKWGKMNNASKKYIKKQQQYFYDEVLEHEQQNKWHIVDNKNKSKNKNQYQNVYAFSNSTAIKDTTFNQQFGYLIQLLQPYNILSQKEITENISIQPIQFYHKLGQLCPKYTQQKQQDAQELLYFVLDCLAQGQFYKVSNRERYEKVEKIIGRQKLTTTHNILGSYFVNCIKCEKCLKQSWKVDLTYGLSVPLSQDIKKQKNPQQQVPEKNRNQPIQKLQYYRKVYYPDSSSKVPKLVQPLFKQQRLSFSNNYWACQSCEGLSATKSLYLLQQPQFLVVSLKRFTHFGKNAKINSHIAFQETMDLSSICLRVEDDISCVDQSNPAVLNKRPVAQYRLQSVIVHEGGYIDSGHYSCYLRMNRQEWCKCSDQKIRLATWKQVSGVQAYILIYSRME